MFHTNHSAQESVSNTLFSLTLQCNCLYRRTKIPQCSNYCMYSYKCTVRVWVAWILPQWFFFWSSPKNPTLVKKQYYPTVQMEDIGWKYRLPQANFLNTIKALTALLPLKCTLLEAVNCSWDGRQQSSCGKQKKNKTVLGKSTLPQAYYPIR